MKKFLIIFLSLFFIIYNDVYATGEISSCGDIVETNENGTTYETRTCQLYDSDEHECQLKFKVMKNNHKALEIYDTTKGGVQIKLDENNSYKCSSYDIKVKFDNSIDTGIEDLSQLAIKYSSTYSRFEISGIITPDENVKVRCTGLDYNLIVDEEDNWVCKVEIYSDKNDNVIMKYGNKEIVNPGKDNNGTPYICETAGDSVTFTLNKEMKKGELSDTSKCPKLIKSGESEADGSDQEIENPDRDSGSDKSTKIPGYDNKIDAPKELGCESIFKGDLQTYMEKIFSIMKYAGIVFCIGFSIADFVKAILDEDKGALNKIAKKVVTRLLLVALLFFLPTIVNFVVKIIDENACTINF